MSLLIKQFVRTSHYCLRYLNTLNRSPFGLNIGSKLESYHSMSSIYSNKLSKSLEKPQNFDYFLVLDFEATCDRPEQIKPMEIIEFPVIKVNANSFETEEIFHCYVKPIHNTTLTTFCTQLTGIIQDMVSNEPQFDVVLSQFEQWLHSVGLLCSDLKRPLKRFTFVTCGEWDLQIMLPDQCQLMNLRIPLYMRTWINIKKSFAEHFGKWPKSLHSMLDELKIRPVGRLHSGVDDCRNVVLIMKALAQRGFVFKNTSSEW